MARRHKNRRRRNQSAVELAMHVVGQSPGALAPPPDATLPEIQVFAYDQSRLVEQAGQRPADLARYLEQYPVTWVNVDGLGDAQTLGELARIFGLHPLAVEDALSRHQRPKVEAYGDQLFIVVRMVVEHGQRLTWEQLSIFVGKNFVLTIQEEHPGDCLEPVRERLRRGSERLRTSGPDFLAYSLLDAVVDHFFPVIEHYGDRLQMLEDQVIFEPQATTVAAVHQAKYELLGLRRALWPLRDAINALLREQLTPHLSAETRIYLRDCYDHTVQLIDVVETYREIGSSLMEVYLSSASNRMNDIMRVLTVLSAIFIPLTFVAGVWGMNFKSEKSPLNMPELNWYWGYPAALGAMGLIALILLVIFWRFGWLRSSRPQRPVDETEPQ